MSPSSPARPPRIHAIDALRVFAMVSVVLLHACVSYMTVPMPDLLWAARDIQTAPYFDWLFFWFRGLTMRVFFLAAGFFAVMLFEKYGPEGFVRNRARRILVPFLVACGFLLPVIYFIWSWGWIETGRADLYQALRLQFPPAIQRNIFGPAHLWFLEFLIIYYALFFLWRRLWPAAPRNGNPLLEKIFFSPWKPLLLAVPGTLILLLDVDVVINFHNTFIPNPFKLLYYGLFFWAGTVLYRFKSRLGDYSSFVWIYFLASVPFFIWMGTLLKRHIAAPLEGAEYLALATSISIFSWFSVFAILGIALKFFDRESRFFGYLSRSSYWIYLCHFPVVGFLQATLLNAGLPAAVKFITVVLTVFAFGFLTYEWFVRRTAIGFCLNGSNSGQEPKPLALSSKTTLSFVVILLTVSAGVAFQNFYNSEKIIYEEIVRGYHLKYFEREIDDGNLRHWTNWALNRWGLEKVERDYFIKMSELEKRGAA